MYVSMQLGVRILVSNRGECQYAVGGDFLSIQWQVSV